MNLDILYEDNHLIAVNKRPGDLVQGDRSGDRPLAEIVKDYIRVRYGKPGNVFLGVVHRLDRPTSGVVLFARTGKALERMNRLFRENRVEKRYWALVAEKPPQAEGSLLHFLRRDRGENKSYASDRAFDRSKEARLSYRLLLSLERCHLLEIEIQTGRHHQIRAQLARIGCHIKGDLKYGFPSSNPDGGIHLHAREIRFQHPVGQAQVLIAADPPGDPLWEAVMERLASTPPPSAPCSD